MVNYYLQDGKYFIIIDNQHLEVCQPLYEVYKNLENKSRYNNEKYYKWNMSLDYDTIVAAKYEYIAANATESTLDLMIFNENLSAIIKELGKTDKKIFKLLLEGATEKEIAYILGVSLKTVYNRKKAIRDLL